jgi:hypothetical protein
MTETVIRTFGRPAMGPVFRLGNEAGTNGIHHDIVPFLIQGFTSTNPMVKKAPMPVDP